MTNQLIENKSLEKVLEVVKEKEIDRVFLVACGGSSALMYSSKYILDRDSTTMTTEVYSSNEFIYRNPATLNKNSLVILCSHLGKTPETTEAAKFAKSKGALTVSFTYVDDSPLAKESDLVIGYEYGSGIDPAESRNILIIQLALGLLKVKESSKKYDKLVASLPNLKAVCDKAIEYYAQDALDFADKYKDEKMIYTMASGSNYGVAYTFAICILMEMQWINSHAIHAGEFFHGPFEILDKDTPFILLLGLDETRYMEERALKFAKEYGEKLIILDAKDLDFKGIDKEIKGEIASVVLLYVLRAFSRKLADVRDHPLEKRRYMFKVPY
jgi:fructoselysine 6-phosphate deglycase